MMTMPLRISFAFMSTESFRSRGKLAGEMTIVKWFRLMLAGTLVVMACRPGREAQTAGTTGDIPVGVYGALTGSEAAFGTSTVQGVQLAADEINSAGGILGGRKIKLYIEDDQGRAEEAASVVTKLITSSDVIGLIG